MVSTGSYVWKINKGEESPGCDFTGVQTLLRSKGTFNNGAIVIVEAALRSGVTSLYGLAFATIVKRTHNVDDCPLERLAVGK